MMQKPIDWSAYEDVGNPNAKPMPDLTPKWWKRTPPSWLRYFVHWRVLTWLDHHLPTCWATMVMWKVYGVDESWWPDPRCFEGYDYSAKFLEAVKVNKEP